MASVMWDLKGHWVFLYIAPAILPALQFQSKAAPDLQIVQTSHKRQVLCILCESCDCMFYLYNDTVGLSLGEHIV